MSLLQQPVSETPLSPLDHSQSESVGRALLNGRLRDELGLSSGDLKIGLTVAKNLLSRGAYVEAMRVYVALVLCEPANADFQVGLANCASVVGEHHLALQAASAVIALAPSDPRGYLLSGRSCLSIGLLAEAEQDLLDALGLATGQGHSIVEQEATLLLSRLALARG